MARNALKAFRESYSSETIYGEMVRHLEVAAGTDHLRPCCTMPTTGLCADVGRRRSLGLVKRKGAGVSDRFSEVTELAGTEISTEQLERMSHRYHWAALHCEQKDVLEAACGSGQGLGILSRVARSVEAGDFSAEILAVAQRHYAGRVTLTRVRRTIPCLSRTGPRM